MNATTYQKVTEIIIEKLEQGVVPWRKPWTDVGAPRNLITKRPYRGINLLLLSCSEYEQPFFLSFNQAKKLGGSVKKNEKAHLVVFYKWLEATDDNGEVILKENGKVKMLPLLRYYYVFNLEQCYGVDPKHVPQLPQREIKPIESAERIINNMPDKPPVCFFGPKAFYNPESDRINMPSKNSFKSDEELYSTLFHEYVHATGHESRLNRREIATATAAFGDELYSKEELVAEMGAAFLCAESGIENRTIDNSAAYIGSWMKALRNDKRLIVIAAGAAQKACDYILNKRSNENG